MRRCSMALIGAAVGVLVSGDVARAATYQWNNAGVVYLDQGPWSPAGPPGAGDTINFFSVGGDGVYEVMWDSFAQSTLPIVAAMNVNADDVTHRSNVNGNPFLLNVTGQAVVAGATTDYRLGALNQPHNLAVGASLDIGTGATVHVGFGSQLNVQSYADVGTAGNGTLLVSGAGSAFNTGAGTTAIMDWGLGAGNTAFVTFSGGATGNIDSTVNIGQDGATGNVTVQGDADVEFDNVDFGFSTTPGSGGTFTVTGAGSTVTGAGASTLRIGGTNATPNAATLNVNAGGAFDTATGAVTVNKSGALQIGGGSFFADGPMTVRGTVTLNSGTFNPRESLTLDGGYLYLLGAGFSHAAGKSMVVQNGGQYSANSLLGSGRTVQAFSDGDILVGGVAEFFSGTLQVNGIGSTLLAGGFDPATTVWGQSGTTNITFEAGSLGVMSAPVQIANGVTATVLVQSGARLDFTNVELGSVSATAATNGTLTVTGAGSTIFQAGASTLSVGSSVVTPGTATVNVNAGGTFTTGTGAVNINKSGKLLSNGGTIDINGPLTVHGLVDQDAGAFTAYNTVMIDGGTLRTDGGTFTRTYGQALTVQNNGQLIVAGELDATSGPTQVLSGADVNVGTSFRLFSGSMLVSGSGSSLAAGTVIPSVFQLQGDLTFSSGATGDLNGTLYSNFQRTLLVQSGASVQIDTFAMGFVNEPGEVTTFTVTGANSVVSQTGGSSTQIGIFGGTERAILNVNSGGLFDSGTGQVTVYSRLNINGGTFKADGHISLDLGTITLNGGELSTVSIGTDYAGLGNPQLVFTAGTFRDQNNLVMTPMDLIPQTRNLTAGKTLAVTNTLTLDGTQVTLNGGSLEVGGISVANGGSLNWISGSFALTGGTGTMPITLQTGFTLPARGNANGRFTGALASTLNATGTLAIGNAAAVNGFYTNGEMNVGANTVTLQDANDAVLDSAALVTIGSGGTPGTLAAPNGLTVDFGANITGHGTINTPNDIAKPLMNNGHIAGASPAQRLTLSGYVKGAGTLDNVTITGTDAPGFSPATVVRGSVAYDGTLQIELAGATPGSGHDQVRHALGSGAASLGGTLELDVINGFVPSQTDTFRFLTYGSRQDRFDTVSGDGAGWAIHYGASAATAIVDEWQSPGQIAGEFVVPGNAEVTGTWNWSGLLVKRGAGDLVLDLDGTYATSNASLAIIEGSVVLGGTGTLVLSSLSFGDLGLLTGDASLAGEYGFFSRAANVPEPAGTTLVVVVIAATMTRRRHRRGSGVTCLSRRTGRLNR